MLLAFFTKESWISC